MEVLNNEILDEAIMLRDGGHQPQGFYQEGLSGFGSFGVSQRCSPNGEIRSRTEARESGDKNLKDFLAD